MVQKGLRFGNSLKRMLSIFVSICLMATILPLAAGVAAAETTAQSVMTDYQPTIQEVIDASGFKHPGVGLTKDFLENVRTQVRAQKEPWNTYFNRMLLSPTAAKNVGSSIQGADPTKPKSVAVNSKGAFVIGWVVGVYAGTYVFYYRRRNLSGQCHENYPTLGANGPQAIYVFHRFSHSYGYPS